MVTLTSSAILITLMFNSLSFAHNLLLFGCSRYQNLFLKYLLENYQFISCMGEEENLFLLLLLLFVSWFIYLFCHSIHNLSTTTTEFSHIPPWYLVAPSPERQTNHFSFDITHQCDFSCSFLCSINAVTSCLSYVLPKILL